jgi:hypothetical protein
MELAMYGMTTKAEQEHYRHRALVGTTECMVTAVLGHIVAGPAVPNLHAPYSSVGVASDRFAQRAPQAPSPPCGRLHLIKLKKEHGSLRVKQEEIIANTHTSYRTACQIPYA